MPSTSARRRVTSRRPSARSPRRAIAALFAVFAAAAALAACSDFSVPGPTTDKLVVSPAQGHVAVGGTMQLAVRGATGAVVWSSSDASVATVSYGKVTGVGSGTATIRAISQGAVASSKITVSRPPAIGLSVTGVTLGGIAGSAQLAIDSSVVVTNTGEDALTGLGLGTIVYSAGGTGWLTASLGATAPARLRLSASAGSLAAGTYTATIPVSAASASNGPLTVSVTFTVIRQASIVLGSPTASFNGEQNNASVPAAQQISITNGGDAPLTGLALGTITYDAGASGWLNASVTPTAAPATLTLQPNTTALTPGDYTATVAVTSTIAGVAPASVTVTYHVANAPTPPVIVLSTSSLAYSATRTAALPAAQTVNVSNGGQVALTGLSATVIYAGGQPTGWLNASLNSTSAPAVLTVQPNSTGLTAGTYDATVRVSSSISGVAPKDVAVTYTVIEPPAIGLTATAATFLATSTTNPAAQQIGVSNTGGGTLSGLAASITYGAGQPTGWLSASVASTAPTAPSTTPLTLSVTASAVSPGTYSATVTLTAPGVTSRTVSVSFTRQATMSGDVWPLISSSGCMGCHSSSAGPEGINLSSATAAQASLVNQPSPSFPTTRTLVIPGDSTNSYLMQILRGTATKLADNMPPNCISTNQSLCRPTLAQLVGIWIVQGARQNP